MKTIVLYKVVFVDQYGDIIEKDFSKESEARTLAASIPDAILYRYKMIGEIVRLI